MTLRIVFPVYGPDKTLLGYKTHKSQHLKHDRTPAGRGEGIPAQLYPWKAIEHDHVILVNGEPSVWKAWDCGYRNVIASTGGEGKFKREWVDLFERKTVDVIFDNDETGLKATQKVCSLIQGKAAEVRIVQWPEDWTRKGDADDWLRAGHKLEDLYFAPWSPATKPIQNGSGKPSQADRLVALVVSKSELFHDQTKAPCVRVSVADHHETLRCQSRNFKRWLSREMFEAEEKAPCAEAVSSALRVIEAKACFEGQRVELQNRVAAHADAIWYDLTDEQWQAIRVTGEGWEVVKDPPPLFYRYEHHAPQVQPVQGGDLNRLFDFIRVADDDSRLLLKVYIVTCLMPDIAHPMPVLHGPQGSGKSTLFKMLRRLVDPSVMEILSFPRNENELVQALDHHWMALFDNVSNLPDWVSDALCRAVTGGGFSKRQLYSNNEDVIYSFRRCVGVNGINVTATKPDLLDRSILIGLDRIPPAERLTDQELWGKFEAARPEILGGALDALSRAMRILPTVNVSNLPRMADFAQRACAVAGAFGCSSDSFLRTYGRNMEAQNIEAIQGHPVAAAVMGFMQGRDDWEGAPSDLLAELKKTAEHEHIDVKDKIWPKAPNAMSRRLNEVRSNLVDAGIEVTMAHSTRRRIQIRRSL